MRLTMMTTTTTLATVKVENKVSENFDSNTGIKQRNGLSAVLCVLGLHYVAKDLDERGTIFNRN